MKLCLKCTFLALWQNDPSWPLVPKAEIIIIIYTKIIIEDYVWETYSSRFLYLFDCELLRAYSLWESLLPLRDYTLKNNRYHHEVIPCMVWYQAFVLFGYGTKICTIWYGLYRMVQNQNFVQYWCTNMIWSKSVSHGWMLCVSDLSCDSIEIIANIFIYNIKN